jgi:hypothetical protein
MKQHKPWFDKKCSKLIHQRKWDKLQWLQNPGHTNGDNVNNARCKTSRTYGEQKEGIPERKNELGTNSKNKNIRSLYRGTNEFKMGYQPRTNLVKDENGDVLADSHSILKRLRNDLHQLLNVHGVNYVRQTEMHTAEPLVPELSSFKVEIAIVQLKGYKSPGTDQIPGRIEQSRQ